MTRSGRIKARKALAAATLALASLLTDAVAAQSIDNSAIGKPDFRPHKATRDRIFQNFARWPSAINCMSCPWA